MEPATPEHGCALALCLRPEDRAEVEASTGAPPVQTILDSIRLSESAFTLFFDDEIAAIWGVVPIRKTVLTDPVGAVVWLLSGAVVNRHPMTFARISKRAIRWLDHRYPVLHNAVDCRYGAALRWVKWLGFEVLDPIPFGHAGLPFCPIIRRAS